MIAFAQATAIPSRQERTQTVAVDAAAETRRQFYHNLGWEGGKVEVVAGSNNSDNPEKIELLIWNKETYSTDAPHTRKWFAPENLTGLDRHVYTMAARWGNVYISVGSYDPVPNPWKPGKMRYCRDAPRPRRCIVLDDVRDLSTLRLPPTWATETSPGNHQVGYTCTELLNPEQAQFLSEGAAMLAGLDNSAADPEQIIRVPTTLNTKLKCVGRPGTADRAPEGWEVRAVILDGPHYTRTELARAFLSGGLVELDRSQSVKRVPKNPHNTSESLGRSLDGEEDDVWMAAVKAAADWRGYLWRDGELWKNGPLLRADGTPRVLRDPQHSINRVIRGDITWAEAAAEWRDKDNSEGGKDNSESGFCYHLIGAFWRAGCEVPQIIAMAEALAPEGRAKGDKWYYHVNLWGCLYRVKQDGTTEGWARLCDDIPRRPLRNFTPLPMDAPSVARRRSRGRPAGERAAQADRLAMLLAALPIDLDGKRRTRSAELAQKLDVSPRMVTHYLADLREAGRLETETEGRALAIVRVEINSPLGMDCTPLVDRPDPHAERVETNSSEDRDRDTTADCRDASTMRVETYPPGVANCEARKAVTEDRVPMLRNPPALYRGDTPAALPPSSSAISSASCVSASKILAEEADVEMHFAMQDIGSNVDRSIGSAEAGERSGGVCSPTAFGPDGVIGVPLAELESLVAAAIDGIHAQRQPRLDKRTGEIRMITPRATLDRVIEHVGHERPDLTPAQITPVYRYLHDGWGLERRRLRQLPDRAVLAACRAAARTLARAMKQDNTRSGYYRMLLQIADEERRTRGLTLVDSAPGQQHSMARRSAQRREAAAATAQRVSTMALQLSFDAEG